MTPHGQPGNATFIETIRGFLRALLHEQNGAWIRPEQGHEASEAAWRAFEHARNHFWTPVRDEDFETWISPGGSAEYPFSEYVLYLPPLKHDTGFIPVLRLMYHDNKWAGLCLTIMFVRVDAGSGGLKSFGFRLEHGSGEHAFYHAQIIKNFHSGPPLESIPWLPETQPSLPLPARCPVTLLLCLLLTLYGKEYYSEFQIKHRIFRIGEYMDDIALWIE